jgi:hypothetical protein
MVSSHLHTVSCLGAISGTRRMESAFLLERITSLRSSMAENVIGEICFFLRPIVSLSTNIHFHSLQFYFLPGRNLSRLGVAISFHGVNSSRRGMELCRQGETLFLRGVALCRQGGELSRQGVKHSLRGVKLCRQGGELCRQGVVPCRQGGELSFLGVKLPLQGGISSLRGVKLPLPLIK